MYSCQSGPSWDPCRPCCPQFNPCPPCPPKENTCCRERCCPEPEPDPCPPKGTPCCRERCHFITEDFGPNPFVFNLEKTTLENPFYRRVLWTGTHLQLTVMCIPPRGEIGLEVHPELDQFLRVEQGRARVLMGSSQFNLTYQRTATAGYAILIPAGTWHNVLNTGDEPLKLYSIYAPIQHPAGTVQCTKADADEAE